VPEIGFNSITGGMQTHHSESAIIYGFNRAVHVYARCGKKRWATRAPVCYLSRLPAFKHSGRLSRSIWIGDFRHLIYPNNVCPVTFFRTKLVFNRDEIVM
jgi:hypothetical protein